MSVKHQLIVALQESHLAIRQLRKQGAPVRLWDDIEKANREALHAAKVPEQKPPVEAVEFCIGAGKGYDYDEVTGDSTPNWSYLDKFASFAEAKAAFHRNCRGYPITEFYTEITYEGGRCERIDEAGGPVLVLVNGLWVEEA